MSSGIVVSSADPGGLGSKEHPITKEVFTGALEGPLTDHFMHTREVWQKVTPTLVLYPTEESTPSGKSDMAGFDAVAESIQTVLLTKGSRPPPPPPPPANPPAPFPPPLTHHDG